MQVITLDASGWRKVSDFYAALLAALKAPPWHGGNVNALLETMIWYDDINGVSPPYTVKIQNVKSAPKDVAEEVVVAATAINEARNDLFNKSGAMRSVHFKIES